MHDKKRKRMIGKWYQIAAFITICSLLTTDIQAQSACTVCTDTFPSIASYEKLKESKSTFSFETAIKQELHFDECFITKKDHYSLLLQKTEIEAFLALMKKSHQKAVNEKKHSIPHIIHQIWFGVTGAPPLLIKQWQKTWRKHHPTWRFIFWNEQMLREHCSKTFTNEHEFQEAKSSGNYARMSDIARYELLYAVGGLYVDTDTICFKSFANLLDNYDFMVNIEPVVYLLTCANCIIGSKKNHPIMAECIKKIHSYSSDTRSVDELFDYSKLPPFIHYFFQSKKLRETLVKTGPGLLTQSVIAGINQHGNHDIIFPSQVLTPLQQKITEQTYSYHDFENIFKDTDTHWVK